MEQAVSNDDYRWENDPYLIPPDKDKEKRTKLAIFRLARDLGDTKESAFPNDETLRKEYADWLTANP